MDHVSRACFSLSNCLGMLIRNLWTKVPTCSHLESLGVPTVFSSQVNEIGTPCKELACNYVWLKPLAMNFPTEVPGAMVLTDIMLHLGNMS